MPKITAPVEGFAGQVVGVQFTDGSAHVKVSETEKVQYFTRHGYTVEETAAEAKARAKAEAERVEAEKAAAEAEQNQA